MIVTRFAPSPTGSLHIGGARTALFNYLFSKRYGGKFFLRIEDTDTKRSTKEALEAILAGLKWLGIDFDPFTQGEEIVYQSKRTQAYEDLISELLKKGKAYKCFATSAEIEERKQQALSQGKSFVLRSPWRDRNDHPIDVPYVVRFKVDPNQTTIIHDQVHEDLKFDNSTIEDFALSRSDGGALYNLCVVCDDHYMGITHIIRGDDHITNAARQTLIYQAMNWDIPAMAHIPLMHGPDGSKLSKRHGATSAFEYKDMGYLPEALVSYLMRLGWSYDSDEIISLEEAISKFDIEHLGKSAARLDFDKMKSVNAFYIKHKDNQGLVDLITDQRMFSDKSKKSLLQGMDSLKTRAKLITELADMAKIYILEEDIVLTDEAKSVLQETDAKVIDDVKALLESATDLSHSALQEEFKKLAAQHNMSLGKMMQPIRCLISGNTASPSVFEIISIIGKEIALKRLNKKV
ncbi:hypothetical protein phytr_10790 [Candidatus Phycorickettsia trachydisci]|uniref:Glutamate--tRNA ligase n=1 Tax=Candidatus Phycorickettsia trachydisci TaxID=2115978 RepID=A0A2P1P9T5_9RICK|nr:glutamate--tRNA ligase [Candidatus Phycorickettsia trachydisci]AVP88006.1 hypothetical protein phytr_10790 [Candidatus Phycorickettsia trachydisci]